MNDFKYNTVALGSGLAGALMLLVGLSACGDDDNKKSDAAILDGSVSTKMALATIQPTPPAVDAGAADAGTTDAGVTINTIAGTAKFQQSGSQVTLTLTLSNCPAGDHGFHLHQNPMCGNAGMDAGGHWNPAMKMHGSNPTDHHSGDTGNVTCDASGNGSLSVTQPTSVWTIGSGDANTDVIGHAVIVHGGKDDLMTDPTGNSGPRIGCGIIAAAL